MAAPMMRLSPLDPWIAGKIGDPGQKLHRAPIHHYQLGKLRETLERAKTQSRFYGDLLRDIDPAGLETVRDIAKLPFTTPDHLRADPLGFLCVSQGEINRVVTLPTSGTTGPVKRTSFTVEDQELTRDFFDVGMTDLTDPGDKVLILLPGPSPGSIGDLLKNALARRKVESLVYGPVADPADVLQLMDQIRPDCLVGIPQQVLAVARYQQARGGSEPEPLKSILLSTDHVPGAIVEELQRVWSCRVYQHYGMTEMGLGGGVDCDDRSGYHLREADLLFEIIDPKTGNPVPPGVDGEIVFTTLTRTGMPLIRYRTGDAGRFLTETCPCGSSLLRLAHIKRRLDGRVLLPKGVELWLDELDELLFTIHGLLDFTAEVSGGPESTVLHLSAITVPGTCLLKEEIAEKVLRIGGLTDLEKGGLLKLDISVHPYDPTLNRGVRKRVIVDQR